MKNIFKPLGIILLLGSCQSMQAMDWAIGGFLYAMSFMSSKNDKKGPIKEVQDAFVKALEKDDAEKVNDFLDEGYDVQLAFRELMESTYDCSKSLQIIIAHGADINHYYGPRAETPLIWAIENKKFERFKQFIAIKNCNINWQDENGKTPLFYAINRSFYPDMAKILIDKGCDLDIVENEGNAIIHRAIEMFKYMELEEEFIKKHWGYEKLAWFISKKNINLKNKKGYTPLHIALKENSSLETIQLLKEHGADFSIENPDGKNGYELFKENARFYGSLDNITEKDE